MNKQNTINKDLITSSDMATITFRRVNRHAADNNTWLQHHVGMVVRMLEYKNGRIDIHVDGARFTHCQGSYTSQYNGWQHYKEAAQQADQNTMNKRDLKILNQYWYQKPGKKWHSDPKFNLVGKHVTVIDVGELEVQEVFCVRNFVTSCTVKFTDGSLFNYEFMNNALYLSASFTVIGKGIVKVEVDLCWYTLSYSYDLIGLKKSYRQSNEIIKRYESRITREGDRAAL